MFLLGLRACLNCGSFAVQKSFLCTYCESKLLDANFCGLEQSNEKGLSVYSLFDWAPQQSDLLSNLLLSLKGPNQAAAWAGWSKHFWLQRALHLSHEGPIVFIPAASSSGKTDHAAHFSQALAQLSGGGWMNVLQKTTKSHQKHQNRDQRAGVNIGCHVKNAAISNEVLYVLVDDVLTTGSTALSSFEALGKPKNFEVWSLAKRSLSCGVSMDLL